MHERTIILSDLHLGRPDGVVHASEIDALVEPGCKLILNGDAAELHHPDHQERAEEELSRLQSLAAARGVELVLLAGNHDPLVSQQRMLMLAEGQVMVTHGDAFHPAVAPWSVSAPAMRAAWQRTMDAMSPERRGTAEARFAAARDAAIAEWLDSGHGATQSTVARLALRPWAAVGIVLYWKRFPRLACRFGELFAPQARILVVGHSHRAGRWRFGGRTVLNTGSFTFPGSPHAVIVDGDQVAMWPIVRKSTSIGTRYVFAPNAASSETLPRGTGSPALSRRDESVLPSADATMRPASKSVATSTPVLSPDPSKA